MIAGTISSDPIKKKNDTRVSLETSRGAIYASIETKEQLFRSERLTLQGELRQGFANYSGFMYHPSIISKASPTTPDFALQARDAISENVIRLMDNEEQSNLALSYLTGQKNLLTEQQKANLRLAGLAHAVVASGFHLSVVVSFAKKIFGKISRFATLAGATLLLIIYMSVTGFSPSIARAGLVTFLSLWAWYYGRKFHPVRMLIFVAALTLLINPDNINNLAWQLSFASYAGIILMTPLISKYLYGEKPPPFLANLIIACISAQLFCLPLTLYAFGSISLLALLANILVSPTISFVMLSTLLAGITTFTPFAFIASQLTQFHLNVINFIANIPWATIEFESNNPATFLLYLPILACLLILKYFTKHSYRPSYAKIYTC